MDAALQYEPGAAREKVSLGMPDMRSAQDGKRSVKVRMAWQILTNPGGHAHGVTTGACPTRGRSGCRAPTAAASGSLDSIPGLGHNGRC